MCICIFQFSLHISRCVQHSFICRLEIGVATPLGKSLKVLDLSSIFKVWKVLENGFVPEKSWKNGS